MRTRLLIPTCILVAFVCLRTTASDPAQLPVAASLPLDRHFRETIRPFLDANCVACHGKTKPEGDLDLSTYASVESVAGDLARWELVLEQLQAGTMPPPKAKRHPKPELRNDVIAWIVAVRKSEALRNAGDPGPVPARRLSNAEYDHTIRDLTGVDIRPTQEFPVDPANESGFDNSAESLTMSPALVKKYLEAAQMVADHLVLKPNGFSFASHPAVADTDRDKYGVRRIIDFYKRQRTDYADYFHAAWRFRHRAALGRPDASPDQFAAEAGLSPKYLATVRSVLNDPAAEVGPIAALQLLWNELPPPDAGTPDRSKAGCARMRDFVVELRRRLTPEVKNLTAPGISNGSQSMVLWKNRRFVMNRRRYVGDATRIKADELLTGTPAARALSVPAKADDIARYEPDLKRFCSIFPDAFVVSERARVYLDPKQSRGNEGRLLNAGFHSMTGYFRDDAPLAELILDDQGRRELDELWREFDFITGAPARQYSSFLWFERAEPPPFLNTPEFNFARAEDKNASSEVMIKRLSEVYLNKARRLGASEVALQAIQDHFEIINTSLRSVERDQIAAEPSHVESLQTFAQRAYRRPLTTSERDGIVAFYRRLRVQDGLKHEDAVRDSIVGILMSPHFCYRTDLAGLGTGVQPISDDALANRLSYFLWSSMPDEELLKRAAAGDLHRPEVLIQQARRMLQDDRVRGLATEFAGNWLDFTRFEAHNSVDRNRFKSFNDELRRSMHEEPIRFFVDLVRHDRPVQEFLDANHTFVNPALARHYGMPEPQNGPDDWVRVENARSFGRGGLLPMAVFLTKNSPGLRTSPVKRGYWVVRRLLGEKIPAPPPNVPDLPDDEAKLGDLTLRETLARHRADKSCAGCHERFDAIGLAFEGYGPVGESRRNDLGGRPVHTQATFPGGDEGSGVDGLRTYLNKNRRPEFVENLCRKLLAYGLGRSLLPSDDEIVDAMRKPSETGGLRISQLVEVIVSSPQFRNKRIDARAAE